jgi:medium-chain acyl-[acyl-carrier-protein] hydrolase
MATASTARWLWRLRARPEASMCLVCLPHAGRGVSVFHPWPAALGDVEVWAAQLPGREGRVRERPLRRVEEIVEPIAESIVGEIDRPFVLFGHSMGALVAFELARTLRRGGAPEPRHVFVAGFRAPQLPDRNPAIAAAPEDIFVGRLVELSGIPPEVLEHEELRAVVMPTLRADVAVCESYTYVADAPLTCDLDAFHSEDDPLVSRDEAAAWAVQTSASFRLHSVRGNHFDLLHGERPAVLGPIAEALAADPSRPPPTIGAALQPVR